MTVWTLMDDLYGAKMGYFIKHIGRVSQHVYGDKTKYLQV